MKTKHTSEWRTGNYDSQCQFVERIDLIETELDCKVVQVTIGRYDNTKAKPGPFMTLEPGMRFAIKVRGPGRWRLHSTRVT
jgi:hypothetical protein